MDTPSVEVNNYGVLKATPLMLIITSAPTDVTRIVADDILPSSSVIGKPINIVACASKVSNETCKKSLHESMNIKDQQRPNL